MDKSVMIGAWLDVETHFSDNLDPQGFVIQNCDDVVDDRPIILLDVFLSKN